MPPKKAVRKPAKKSARNTSARKTARRKLSPAHKSALAEGRAASATVDRYLSALNEPKPRGRRVSVATLEQRLTAARARLKAAGGIDRLMAAQEVRDTQAKLAKINTTSSMVDMKTLESNFVKVAKKFGENRKIGYGAWRDAGVSAAVLTRAGVARTRG
jgi:hypothetical protein